MSARSERRRRWRNGAASGTSVNLISMMDVLTVLLLFLLKSYVAGEVMVPPKGVQLPASSAQQEPRSSLVVVISKDAVSIGDTPIASLDDVARGGLEIPPLADHLRATASATPSSGARVATIQGDRDIEFRVLKRVMYTLNQNGYEDIALAVLRRS